MTGDSKEGDSSDAKKDSVAAAVNEWGGGDQNGGGGSSSSQLSALLSSNSGGRANAASNGNGDATVATAKRFVRKGISQFGFSLSLLQSPGLSDPTGGGGGGGAGGGDNSQDDSSSAGAKDDDDDDDDDDEKAEGQDPEKLKAFNVSCFRVKKVNYWLLSYLRRSLSTEYKVSGQEGGKVRPLRE